MEQPLIDDDVNVYVIDDVKRIAMYETDGAPARLPLATPEMCHAAPWTGACAIGHWLEFRTDDWLRAPRRTVGRLELAEPVVPVGYERVASSVETHVTNCLGAMAAGDNGFPEGGAVFSVAPGIAGLSILRQAPPGARSGTTTCAQAAAWANEGLLYHPCVRAGHVAPDAAYQLACPIGTIDADQFDARQLRGFLNASAMHAWFSLRRRWFYERRTGVYVAAADRDCLSVTHDLLPYLAQWIGYTLDSAAAEAAGCDAAFVAHVRAAAAAGADTVRLTEVAAKALSMRSFVTLVSEALYLSSRPHEIAHIAEVLFAQDSPRRARRSATQRQPPTPRRPRQRQRRGSALAGLVAVAAAVTGTDDDDDNDDGGGDDDDDFNIAPLGKRRRGGTGARSAPPPPPPLMAARGLRWLGRAPERPRTRREYPLYDPRENLHASMRAAKQWFERTGFALAGVSAQMQAMSHTTRPTTLRASMVGTFNRGVRCVLRDKDACYYVTSLHMTPVNPLIHLDFPLQRDRPCPSAAPAAADRATRAYVHRAVRTIWSVLQAYQVPVSDQAAIGASLNKTRVGAEQRAATKPRAVRRARAELSGDSSDRVAAVAARDDDDIADDDAAISEGASRSAVTRRGATAVTSSTPGAARLVGCTRRTNVLHYGYDTRGTQRMATAPTRLAMVRFGLPRDKGGVEMAILPPALYPRGDPDPAPVNLLRANYLHPLETRPVSLCNAWLRADWYPSAAAERVLVPVERAQLAGALALEQHVPLGREVPVPPTLRVWHRRLRAELARARLAQLEDVPETCAFRGADDARSVAFVFNAALRCGTPVSGAWLLLLWYEWIDRISPLWAHPGYDPAAAPLPPPSARGDDDVADDDDVIDTDAITSLTGPVDDPLLRFPRAGGGAAETVWCMRARLWPAGADTDDLPEGATMFPPSPALVATLLRLVANAWDSGLRCLVHARAFADEGTTGLAAFVEQALATPLAEFRALALRVTDPTRWPLAASRQRGPEIAAAARAVVAHLAARPDALRRLLLHRDARLYRGETRVPLDDVIDPPHAPGLFRLGRHLDLATSQRDMHALLELRAASAVAANAAQEARASQAVHVRALFAALAPTLRRAGQDDPRVTRRGTAGGADDDDDDIDLLTGPPGAVFIGGSAYRVTLGGDAPVDTPTLAYWVYSALVAPAVDLILAVFRPASAPPVRAAAAGASTQAMSPSQALWWSPADFPPMRTVGIYRAAQSMDRAMRAMRAQWGDHPIDTRELAEIATGNAYIEQALLACAVAVQTDGAAPGEDAVAHRQRLAWQRALDPVRRALLGADRAAARAVPRAILAPDVAATADPRVDRVTGAGGLGIENDADAVRWMQWAAARQLHNGTRREPMLESIAAILRSLGYSAAGIAAAPEIDRAALRYALAATGAQFGACGATEARDVWDAHYRAAERIAAAVGAVLACGIRAEARDALRDAVLETAEPCSTAAGTYRYPPSPPRTRHSDILAALFVAETHAHARVAFAPTDAARRDALRASSSPRAPADGASLCIAPSVATVAGLPAPATQLLLCPPPPAPAADTQLALVPVPPQQLLLCPPPPPSDSQLALVPSAAAAEPIAASNFWQSACAGVPPRAYGTDIDDLLRDMEVGEANFSVW